MPLPPEVSFDKRPSRAQDDVTERYSRAAAELLHDVTEDHRRLRIVDYGSLITATLGVEAPDPEMNDQPVFWRFSNRWVDLSNQSRPLGVRGVTLIESSPEPFPMDTLKLARNTGPGQPRWAYVASRKYYLQDTLTTPDGIVVTQDIHQNFPGPGQSMPDMLGNVRRTVDTMSAEQVAQAHRVTEAIFTGLGFNVEAIRAGHALEAASD